MNKVCVFVWSILGVMKASFGKVVHLTQEYQRKALLRNQMTCLRKMVTDTSNVTGLHCQRTWDNIMCWPDTPAGSTIYQPCPSYIHGFDTEENASRICLPNGTWYVRSSVNGSSSGWTNFTSCVANVTEQPSHDFNLGVADIVLKHMNEFRLMYNIGYALSLVCLLLAAGIMIYFRRLHCPRNAIHLNLFLAFILRATMNIIKENLFVQGLGFPVDVAYDENGTMYFTDGPHWECRLFFSLFQYVLTASYIWIFVEGLYLHMLIFVSVFTEKTRVLWYMVFGWSVPLPFVLGWAIARLVIDNSLCWNTSTNSVGLTWIMKGPVMISIVLNFLFFISIVRVLFTKLTSSHCPESKRLRYRRLARSTLVLIPIFGVYYIVFTFPLDNLDDTTSFVILFIEMFFNSYQGVIIAIVLCFANAEVRGEIRKAWNRHHLRRNSGISMNHTQTRIRRQSREAHVSESCNIGDDSGKERFYKNNTSFTHVDDTHSNDGKMLERTNEQEKCTEMTNLLHPKDSLRTDRQLSTDDKELKVKIDIFNIQRSTKDDIPRNLSSLHIETLQNGTKIGETNHINNNSQVPEIVVEPEAETATLKHENVFFVT